jgi:hypothetical protein
MSTRFKTILLASLILALIANLIFASQTEHLISPSLASQYFDEAKSAAGKQDLWNQPLYGPMLFVDSNSRSVVTNQADPQGLLRKQGDVFIGELPEVVNIANTSTAWAGVTWAMVMWPLPTERQERVQLMTHELFHRMQDSLKLPGSNPINRHLDAQDGRTWLRMEWRALARALAERGALRRGAVADAIFFRSYRRSLFPQAADDERALEINEGLAEYTGLKLSSNSEGECVARAGVKLRQAQSGQSFTRSFAYVTGPAYGLLLDAAEKTWRRRIKAGDDLGVILQKAMGLKVPAVSASEAVHRSAHYDGDELIAVEAERENRRKETTAKYRSRLIEGPVLLLPVRNINYSYNPNNVASFEDVGVLYPTARITDDWGILEVTDGVLMFRDSSAIKKLHVSAPTDLQARPLLGLGWKLTLNEGWEIGAGERSGDLILRKKG